MSKNYVMQNRPDNLLNEVDKMSANKFRESNPSSSAHKQYIVVFLSGLPRLRKLLESGFCAFHEPSLVL